MVEQALLFEECRPPRMYGRAELRGIRLRAMHGSPDAEHALWLVTYVIPLCLLFLGSDHPRLVPGHVLHGAPVGLSQGQFVCHGLIVVTRPGVYAMLKSG